jgi:RimJ/RimL family protein N-acetyltransferase
MKENRLQILSTHRLSLNTTVDKDIPALHSMIFSDPEVMRFAFDGRTLSMEECQNYIRQHFKLTEYLTGIATLWEKATEEVIGVAGLIPCRPLGKEDMELGFVLARSAWGKGYATEIGKAQIDFGFDTLKLDRLIAMVHPDNRASEHVIVKLGLHFQTEANMEGRGPRKVYVINHP